MLKSTNFRFGLVFWAGLCLILAPSAHAGPSPANGSSVDSSTAAGDFFEPIEIVVVPIPGSDTEIEVNVRTGEITTSPELLAAVSRKAETIIAQLQSGQINIATLNGESVSLSQTDLDALVRILISTTNDTSSQIDGLASEIYLASISPEAGHNLVADTTTDTYSQINELASEISLSGVSSEAEQDLLSALAGMFQCSLSSDSSLGVSTNDVLSQCGEITVDVNKLSDSIIAYNDIVMSSNLEDLQLLSNDSLFLLIGQLLRELREPLESSSS